MVCVQCLVMVQLFLWRHFLCDVRSPPDIGYPSRDEIIYFRDNDYWRINCSLRGVHLPTKFRWIQNNSVVPQAKDIGFDEDTGHLLIRRFSRSLEGMYRCLAIRDFDSVEAGEITAISISPAIYLRRCWIQPFPILQEIRRQTKELHYFSLGCGDFQISTGPIKYQWYHADTNIPADDGDRIYSNLLGVLFFDWIEVTDTGKELICSISAVIHGVPYAQWGRVNKLAVERNTIGPKESAPFQLYVTSRVVAKRLTDAQLECIFTQHYASVSDYRHKLTYWSLPSGTAIQNSTKYYMQNMGKRLTIRDVTENDEMYYTCMRYNLHGTTTSKVFLDVTSPPVFIYGPPPDKTVIQGNDVDFNCETRSVSGETPPQQTVWYVNGKKFGTTYDTSKVQFHQNNTILIFKNAKKDLHILCVQCEVANNVGTTFADACLNVLLPMVIETSPPEKQTVAFGDIVNLTVTAIADPSVRLDYRWQFGTNSFEMNSTPPYYVVNPATMEVYINTSLMTEDEMRQLEGLHTIIVYHDYEKATLKTDVTVILPETNETTSNATGSTLPDTSTLPNEQSSSDGTKLPETTMTTIKYDISAGTHPYFVSVPMVIVTANLIGGFCLLLGVSVCVLRERKTSETNPEEEQQTTVMYDQSIGYFNAKEKKDSAISRDSVSSVDPIEFDMK